MSESEYYKGPRLIKATLDGIDVTDIVQKYYGENNNWGGKLWKYKDIFGSKYSGKIYCEFISDGRKQWFYGWIDNVNNYFNPPIKKI